MDNEIKHLFKIPQYPYDGDTFAICVIPNEDGNYEVRKETSYAINNVQNEDSKTCVFYNNHLFKPNSIIRLVLPGQCSNRVEQYFTYVAVIDTWICYWQILPEMNNVNVYIRYFKYLKNDGENTYDAEPDVNDVVLKTLIPVYETYDNDATGICPILYIGYEKYSVPGNTIFKYETSIREVLSKLEIESAPIDYNGHINCAGEYYTGLMYSGLLNKLYTTIGNRDDIPLYDSAEYLTPLVGCEINYNDNVMNSDRKKYDNFNIHKYLTKKTYYKEKDVTYSNTIQINSDDGLNLKWYINDVTDNTLGILNFITSYEYACKYEDYINVATKHHDSRIMYIKKPNGFNNTFEDYYNKPITHSDNHYSFSASSVRVYYTHCTSYTEGNVDLLDKFYDYNSRLNLDAYKFKYFFVHIDGDYSFYNEIPEYLDCFVILESDANNTVNLTINRSDLVGVVSPRELILKEPMSLDEKYNYFIKNNFTIGSEDPVNINVDRIGSIQISSSSINNNNPFLFLSNDILDHDYIAAMIPFKNDKKALGMHEQSKYADIIYPHEMDGIKYPFFEFVGEDINPEGLKEILLNGPKFFTSKKNKATDSAGRLQYVSMSVYMSYNDKDIIKYDPTNKFVYTDDLWEVTKTLNAIYSWGKIGHITQYYNGEVISDTYYDYPIKDVNFMLYDNDQEENANLINVDMEDVCEYVEVLTKMDDDWYNKFDMSSISNYAKLDVPHTFRINVSRYEFSNIYKNEINTKDYTDSTYINNLFSWKFSENNVLTSFYKDYTNYENVLFEKHNKDNIAYARSQNMLKEKLGKDYYHNMLNPWDLTDKMKRTQALLNDIVECESYGQIKRLLSQSNIENTHARIYESNDIEEIKKYFPHIREYMDGNSEKCLFHDSPHKFSKKANKAELLSIKRDDIYFNSGYLYPTGILFNWINNNASPKFRKIYVNGLKPAVDVLEESFIIKSFSDNDDSRYLTQILHNPLKQNICLTNFNKVEEKMKNIMNEKNIKFNINVESSDVYVDIIYYDKCFMPV